MNFRSLLKDMRDTRSIRSSLFSPLLGEVGRNLGSNTTILRYEKSEQVHDLSKDTVFHINLKDRDLSQLAELTDTQDLILFIWQNLKDAFKNHSRAYGSNSTFYYIGSDFKVVRHSPLRFAQSPAINDEIILAVLDRWKNGGELYLECTYLVNILTELGYLSEDMRQRLENTSVFAKTFLQILEEQAHLKIKKTKASAVPKKNASGITTDPSSKLKEFEAKLLQALKDRKHQNLTYHPYQFRKCISFME